MALVYQKYKRNAKSQVCFANNPVSGLLIVIGLFMGSPAVKSPLHHPIPSRQCRQRMSLIQLHRETFKVGRASLICSFAAYVLAKYCGMGEEQVQVSFLLISRSKLKFQNDHIYILYSRTAWLNSMGFSLARLSSHFGQCLLVIFFHALVKSLCRCGATRVDTSNGHQGESWLRQYGRWLWLDPPPQSSWTGTSVSNSQTDQKKNYFLFTAESYNCNLSRAVAGFLAGVKASHHSTDKESRDRLDLGVNIFLSWSEQLEEKNYLGLINLRSILPTLPDFMWFLPNFDWTNFERK